MEYFHLLLEASLSATVATAIIFLLRALLKNKIDRRVFILLWTIIIFRLIVIQSVPSPWSFSHLIVESQLHPTVFLEKNEKIATNNSTITQQIHANIPLPQEIKQNSTENLLATTKTNQQTEQIPILFTLWLIGATAMITAITIIYLLFNRKCNNAFLVSDIGYQEELNGTKVYLNDQISSPVTIGILKPQIHLPAGFDLKNTEIVRHVLLHEKTHIKRHDNLLKLIMLIALSLHWFNPIVWFLCRQLNKDIEFSCDSSTIAQIGEKNKAIYAKTLVTMAEKSHEINLAGLVFVSFESGFLKERVLNIMTRKNSVVLSTILAVVFSLGLFTVFATNPQIINAESIVNLIGQEKAQQIALNAAGAGTITEFKQESKNGIIVYEIEIKNGDLKHEIIINAYDGSIIRHSKKQKRYNANTNSNGLYITREKAQSTALSVTDGGTVVKYELDREQYGAKYEFTIIKGDTKHKVDINAETNTIISAKREPIVQLTMVPAADMLSPEKAQQIALNQIGSGIVTECKLEYEKKYGVAVYEVTVVKDNTEHEYDIDARTGAILKYEIEYEVEYYDEVQ